MSHNQITVNSQKPNRLSAIDTSLENLTDVTISSIAANQALVYTGSAWENSNNPITLGTVFVGEGATQAYSNSAASGTASGDVVEFYASAPYNNLSATITSSSNWISSVTLNPGTYRINANVALSFSSAGSVSFQVHQDNTAVGGVGYCAQDDVDCHNPAVALVTVAAATTDVFNVKLTSTGSNINTVSNQGNRQAELGYFIVERLS
ncbi:hypothetical protein [uncultured Idiomarina sp.]|uniref:hypothetical protein n=1 Tax=uncultured Idiomarina sp. TaxID=352961 RepID=UPI0032B1C673|tara:strand:+ start:1135 stop:1755 length:621 start_codon:yes stop_codon:yes gene_type:complete